MISFSYLYTELQLQISVFVFLTSQPIQKIQGDPTRNDNANCLSQMIC